MPRALLLVLVVGCGGISIEAEGDATSPVDALSFATACDWPEVARTSYARPDGCTWAIRTTDPERVRFASLDGCVLELTGLDGRDVAILVATVPGEQAMNLTDAEPCR